VNSAIYESVVQTFETLAESSLLLSSSTSGATKFLKLHDHKSFSSLRVTERSSRRRLERISTGNKEASGGKEDDDDDDDDDDDNDDDDDDYEEEDSKSDDDDDDDDDAADDDADDADDYADDYADDDVASN
jgi:hypothetical protein